MKKHIEKLKASMPKILEKLPIKKFPLKVNKELKTPLLTLAIGLLLGYLVTSSGFLPNTKTVKPEKAKVLFETYLKTLSLEQYKINTIVEEGDIYKVSLTVNGSDFTSYITKDGKLLFPSGIALTPAQETKGTETDNQPQVSKELPKSDKPVVELFVMSHCPYGTQMEKGMLPVVDALGDKIDFTIKFVDYAMHGEKEVKEELNQYCIQKEMGKQTYISYLKCFLDKGDSEGCLKTTKINTNTLSACTKKVDNEFKIMANFNDKSTWKGSFPPFNTSKADNVKYGVQGSPTLIINGVESQSSRDSASLLATVCKAFNNAPAECNSKLDASSPAPGFGYNKTTTDASAAQCGN